MNCLLTRGTERERIVHLDATAALGLRELDPLDDVGNAVCNFGIDTRAARARNVTVRRDEELRRHRARQARLREQLLLVAVRDLLNVALDVATDDRLIEVTLCVRLTDRHRRNRRAATAHTTATTADAVTRARARAVTDRAVAAGTDRAPARTTATRTEARATEAEATVHLACLVAEQTTVDVRVVEAARDVARTG